MEKFSRFVCAVGLVLGSLVAAGCPEQEALTDAEKCGMLAEAICDRRAECSSSFLPSAADRQRAADTCAPLVRSNVLHCDEAIRVGPAFDTCLSEVSSATCLKQTTSLGTSFDIKTPSACEHVVIED